MVILFAMTGCTTPSTPAPRVAEGGDASEPADIKAVWAPDGITLDGRLEDHAWKQAPRYRLALPDDQAEDGDNTTRERALCRFAYDRDYLYVCFELTDHDIIQENDQNQQYHFRTGDVVELFLKPKKASYYWELYATPKGNRTAFFFPSRGYFGLPGALNDQVGLRVAASVDGTLNHWRDTDTGWTAEMAVPLDKLAEEGIPLEAGRDWTVLVARYNYGRQLSKKELSSFPPMPKADWHAYEHFAPLRLQPATP